MHSITKAMIAFIIGYTLFVIVPFFILNLIAWLLGLAPAPWDAISQAAGL
jgi:hypothetical protein